MSDTWSGNTSTSWFTAGNWSGGHPTVSPTGSETVVISGTSSNQPVISPLLTGATKMCVAQAMSAGGSTYPVFEDTQIEVAGFV